VLEKRYSKVKYLVAAEAEQDTQHDAQQGSRFVRDEMDDDADAGSMLSEDLDDTSRSDTSSSEADDETEADGLDEEPGQSDLALSSKQDVIEVASSAGGTAATADAAAANVASEQAKRRQRAYQQYLGYDCELLASLLAPKRELCHQKFELVIDDLAFVGHPVCIDKDGRWDPESPNVEQVDTRGRGLARKGETQDADTQAPSVRASSSPQMTLFHFVLVLDRPDPSPDLPALDLTSWLQIFYDNVAFKMTAALFAEEVRHSYVSRECEKIGQLRERCMDDGQSYGSFLTLAVHTSSLARCLEQVHSSISLSSNAFVTINDSIDAHLQLPPLIHNPVRLMKMADIETPIDLNDPLFASGKNAATVRLLAENDGVLYEELNRTTGPFLMPWKTLLILRDDHQHVAVRRDAGQDEGHEDGSMASLPTDKGVEAWAQKFTSLLKPTLEGVPTLADMADLLDWDIEEDVYPMVRHLIYYREARVVDVPRIQNYYAVSPLFELVNLSRLSTSWSIRFHALPPLPAFLASLSSALRPFSTLVRRRDQRNICLEALIWLLKHDVICQMHVRLRLIASEACKIRAAAARNEERIRIKQKREARAARSKKQQAAKQSSQAAEEAMALERGRVRDRVNSPDELQDGAVPAVQSALSATRPDLAGQAQSDQASRVSPEQSRKPKAGAVSQIDEELRFERRPVLRSRSPSRLIPMSAELGASFGKAAANLAGTSQGGMPGGSRSSTPIGRTRFFPRDDARVAPVDESSQKASTPKSPNLTQTPSSIPLSVRGVQVQPDTSGGGGGRRRSPSVARLRVTGFGDDEEVYLEGRSQPDKTDDGLLKVFGSQDSRRKGLLATHDEMRRLSLVGEENVGAVAGGKLVRQTSNRAPADEQGEDSADRTGEEKKADDRSVEGEDQDEDSEDDELLQYDIDFEPWESRPIATIISEPSRASGDENEWIAAMVEGREAWLAERLYKLLPFLNGKHTIDEIVYRLEWRRKDLRAVLNAFRDDIITFVHP
jgi:hypothetical protein